jgi:hypothetical protein
MELGQSGVLFLASGFPESRSASNKGNQTIAISFHINSVVSDGDSF